MSCSKRKQAEQVEDSAVFGFSLVMNTMYSISQFQQIQFNLWFQILWSKKRSPGKKILQSPTFGSLNLKMGFWIQLRWEIGSAVAGSCLIWYLESQLFTQFGDLWKQKIESLSTINSLLIGLASSVQGHSLFSRCLVIQALKCLPTITQTSLSSSSGSSTKSTGKHRVKCNRLLPTIPPAVIMHRSFTILSCLCP